MPAPPEQQGGPPAGEPPQVPPSTAAILADRADGPSRARERIAARDQHRRVCRQLEALAPLAVFYGPRPPLRAVPLAQLLAERWWAA